MMNKYKDRNWIRFCIDNPYLILGKESTTNTNRDFKNITKNNV